MTSEIRRTLLDLRPNTRYSVRVRSRNSFAVPSEWSEALEFVTTPSSGTPRKPENIQWDFSGRDLDITWTSVTANDDGTTMTNFAYYEIVFYTGSGEDDLQKYATKRVVDNAFTWRYPDAVVQPWFRIYTVNTLGVKSEPSVLAYAPNQIPPPAEDPVVQRAYTQHTLTLGPKIDDLQHYKIQITWYNGFIQLGTEEVHATSQSYSHSVFPTLIYKYVVQLVDLYGQIGDPSNEVLATALSLGDSEENIAYTNIENTFATAQIVGSPTNNFHAATKKYVDDAIAGVGGGPGSGLVLATTTKTSTYTAANGDVVLCNTSGGGFTVNLPAAASNTDAYIVIKKISSDGNTLTIDGNALETIDGSTTYTITTQYLSVTLICDGSAWHII